VDVAVLSKLPSWSGREAVALSRRSVIDSTANMVATSFCATMTHPDRRLVVPDHREIGKATLRSIIREAGLTIEEFVALL
jgi:HicA toxin of bacterial toxin-antitoxin,